MLEQLPGRGLRTKVSSTYVLIGLLAVGVLTQAWLMSAVDSSARLQTAMTMFVGVFVQAVPFLVLGVVVSGVIAAFISPNLLRKVLPRNEKAAIGVGGLAGVALPGCECGVVPVARRLIDQGAPSSVALAFLLSAPAVNPVVLVSTAVAFPGEPGMVAGRFVASLATAVVMGLLWSRFGSPSWMLPRGGADHCVSGRTRAAVFVEAARHDLLQAGAFLVLGAAIAAALHVIVPPHWYEQLATQMLLAILVLAILAVVLALCSEADAFVAASMSSLPLLPRLVFLVVGPAVDVKLFAMQAGTFGRAFALRFAPVTFVVAVVCATVVGYVTLGGAR
ncbi:permease [Nocardia puris]|uniref:permease n=1 Tax=Nocardia puris TaxID=208602 RepID=UPI0018943577|nr:permease [Nocardia puris]MBF6212573.1 permease [Nocardia puris]MBF6369153.1 permease [Nocardia puris]MBF6461162.1 permease [Nocardia puris]